MSEFQNISYVNAKKQIFGSSLGSVSSIIELNGDLFINKSGQVSGTLRATNTERGIDGLLTFENGYIFYKKDNESVKIDPNDMTSLLVLGSGHKKQSKVNGLVVTDDMINNQSNKNRLLSIEAQALSSILAVFNSDEWIANANFAYETSGLSLRGCSWWQKMAIYAAAGSIAALSGMGCSAVAAGCGVTIFVSWGATGIPCFLVTAACWTASAGGTMAAYDALMNYYC